MSTFIFYSLLDLVFFKPLKTKLVQRSPCLFHLVSNEANLIQTITNTKHDNQCIASIKSGSKVPFHLGSRFASIALLQTSNYGTFFSYLTLCCLEWFACSNPVLVFFYPFLNYLINASPNLSYPCMVHHPRITSA